MRKRGKVYIACSIFLSLVLLMNGCFIANQAKENRFYSDAKKHIKDKYGLDTKSVLLYQPSDRSCSDINGIGRIRYSGAEFALLELTNGENVVVSYVDGNYADGYESLDLYTTWLSDVSQEIGEEVTRIDLYTEELEQYGNTYTEKRFGTFLERSTIRYNASNTGEFEDAFYSYMNPLEIRMDLYKEEPTPEWIDEVAESLNRYRKKHGVDLLTADVYTEKPAYSQWLTAKDLSNRRIDGGGEYVVMHEYVDHYRNHFFTITIRFGSVTYDCWEGYYKTMRED